MATICLYYMPSEKISREEMIVDTEFSDIERRLNEPSECLARLKTLSAKSRNDSKVYDHLQNLDDLTRFGTPK